MSVNQMKLGIADPSGAAATWRKAYSRNSANLFTGASIASEFRQQGDQPSIQNKYNYKKQVITGIHGLPFDQQNDDNYWQSKQMLPNILRPLGNGIRNAMLINEGVYNINPIGGTNEYGGGLVSLASGLNPTNYSISNTNDIQDRLRANAVPENDPLSAQFALRLPQGQAFDPNNIEGDAMLNTFESETSVIRNAKTQAYNGNMQPAGFEGSFGYARKRNALMRLNDKLKNVSKESMLSNLLVNGEKFLDLLTAHSKGGIQLSKERYKEIVKNSVSDVPQKEESTTEEDTVGQAIAGDQNPLKAIEITNAPVSIDTNRRQSNVQQNVGNIDNQNQTPFKNEMPAVDAKVTLQNKQDRAAITIAGDRMLHSVGRNKESVTSSRSGKAMGGGGDATVNLKGDQRRRAEKSIPLQIANPSVSDIAERDAEYARSVESMGEMGSRRRFDYKSHFGNLAGSFSLGNSDFQKWLGQVYAKYAHEADNVGEKMNYERDRALFDIETNPETMKKFREEFVTLQEMMATNASDVVSNMMNTSSDLPTNIHTRDLEPMTHNVVRSTPSMDEDNVHIPEVSGRFVKEGGGSASMGSVIDSQIRKDVIAESNQIKELKKQIENLQKEKETLMSEKADKDKQAAVNAALLESQKQINELIKSHAAEKENIILRAGTGMLSMSEERRVSEQNIMKAAEATNTELMNRQMNLMLENARSSESRVLELRKMYDELSQESDINRGALEDLRGEMQGIANENNTTRTVLSRAMAYFATQVAQVENATDQIHDMHMNQALEPAVNNIYHNYTQITNHHNNVEKQLLIGNGATMDLPLLNNNSNMGTYDTSHQMSEFAQSNNHNSNSNTLVGDRSLPLAIEDATEKLRDEQNAVASQVLGRPFVDIQGYMSTYSNAPQERYEDIHRALVMYANAHYDYKDEGLNEFIAKHASDAIHRAYMTGNLDTFTPILSAISNKHFGRDDIELKYAGPPTTKNELTAYGGYFAQDLKDTSFRTSQWKQQKRAKVLDAILQEAEFNDVIDPIGLTVGIGESKRHYVSATRTRQGYRTPMDNPSRLI